MLPVLIRPGKLGDVVLLGAVTSALGRCVVATAPRYASVAGRLRGVERVIGLDAVRAEPGPRFDLTASLRTRRIPARGRIHKRSVRRQLWLRRLLPGPVRPTVPALYAETLGVRALPPPWIEVPVRRRDTLVLVPGAAFGPKRWPGTHHSALGRRWSGPVAVIGGPGEDALVRSVVEGIPGASGLVEEGFSATIELLARAAVVVAGDTGLLHLGAAVGAPVVGLFGPTHPDDGFFPYLRGEVVQISRSCRPCALHRVERCHVGDHGCLRELDIATVWSGVRRWATGPSP